MGVINLTGETSEPLIAAHTTEVSEPAAYRLARRAGELVLQGRFDGIRIEHMEGIGWVQCHVSEWRDLPTVDLQAPETEALREALDTIMPRVPGSF